MNTNDLLDLAHECGASIHKFGTDSIVFYHDDQLTAFAEKIKAAKTQPEFCCVHSWQAAKDAAWVLAQNTSCGCDRYESCIKCFPLEFRTGGKFSEYRSTPAAQSPESEPPSMPEQFPQAR